MARVEHQRIAFRAVLMLCAALSWTSMTSAHEGERDPGRHFEAREPRKPSVGVKWESLTDTQREVLARFQDRWDQLPLARQ